MSDPHFDNSNLSSGTTPRSHSELQKNETLRHRVSNPYMHHAQIIAFSPPILKNKSSRWYIQWTITYPGNIHVRQKRSFGINRGKNDQEKTALAKRVLMDFRPEKYLPASAPRINKTITDPRIAEYVSSHRGYWKKKTISTYTGKLNIFNTWLQQKCIPPHKLTAAGARAFMQHLITSRHSGHTTCNAYRATLWQMYNTWPETKRANPFDEIKMFPDSKTGKRAFTADQRAQLTSHIQRTDPSLHLFISFMYYCFLRPEEIRNLKISSINWQQQSIQLPFFNSKTNRNRVHAIPPVFITRLQYLKQADKSCYIFGPQLTPSRVMIGTTFFYKRMRGVLNILKFSKEYSLYSWRHTAAIELYKKHHDLRLVQMAMGHTTITTTEKYLKSLGVLEDLRLYDRDPM